MNYLHFLVEGKVLSLTLEDGVLCCMSYKSNSCMQFDDLTNGNNNKVFVVVIINCKNECGYITLSGIGQNVASYPDRHFREGMLWN